MPQERIVMTFRSFVAAAVLCSAALPAHAQERSNASYATEAGVVYSFLRDVGENATTGMVVDFGKQLTPHLSAIGEFGLNHFATIEETYAQVAGGVRVGSLVNGRVRPFAQVLIGVQHEFGSSGLNVQPGAGLNVRLGKGVDARVQVDVPFLRWEGESYKQVRLGLGLGVPLGR
jgi:hypothetical protein